MWCPKSCRDHGEQPQYAWTRVCGFAGGTTAIFFSPFLLPLLEGGAAAADVFLIHCGGNIKFVKRDAGCPATASCWHTADEHFTGPLGNNILGPYLQDNDCKHNPHFWVLFNEWNEIHYDQMFNKSGFVSRAQKNIHMTVCYCNWEWSVCSVTLHWPFPFRHQLFNHPNNRRKLSLMLNNTPITWFTKVTLYNKSWN